ncbi:MAG: hypothetical protein IID37_09200 [Planctomycetes bacterium]|nr:hypothetical protein [Planctomycetota bacterium]
MSSQSKRSSYAAFVAKVQGTYSPPKIDCAETKLDSLLVERDERAKNSSANTDRPVSPLDRLRNRMISDYCPLVDDLAAKYVTCGIALRMDITDFLSGGRGIDIAIDFQGQGLRLSGIATDVGIAFQETRIHQGIDGTVTSGPMLRTRTLTNDQFRDFICDHIAALVRMVDRDR